MQVLHRGFMTKITLTLINLYRNAILSIFCASQMQYFDDKWKRLVFFSRMSSQNERVHGYFCCDRRTVSVTYFGKAVLCVKKLDSYYLLFLKLKSSKRKFNKCFWIVDDSTHVLIPWILAFLSNSIIIVFSTQSLTYQNVKCYWNNLPENQDNLL